MTESPPGPRDLSEIAERASLRRIAMVAWRDLGDPEAGGSELHAHEIARRWAEAGIDVVLRTSAVAGSPPRLVRDGYGVVRRSGRYKVFGTAPFDIAAGRLGPLDGLVEVWNGMPFFSPLWGRLPKVTFLHHVHAEMWHMVLPPRLARLGEVLEARVAPPFYRGTRIVTLSESSRREIVDMLGMREEMVTVVPPGIDPQYLPPLPDEVRAPAPLIVAVGRLVPVKRFDRLIAAVAELHEQRPHVECVIVGEGVERGRLEALRHRLGADEYISMPGRLTDLALVAAYRRAWVVASTSVREGWGMTLSEAAACGTPAVASRIAGHGDVVVDGVTGYLVSSREEMVRRLQDLVDDGELRAAFSKAAIERAADLTWQATAVGTLQALATEATRSKASRSNAETSSSSRRAARGRAGRSGRAGRR